jgi:chaperonin GroES
MTIVPLYDKVLVQKTEAEDMTEGGIYKPSTVEEDQVIAQVIAVGEGRLLSSGKTIPPKVSVGDTVILGKFTGTKVKYGGEKYMLIREDDILAVVME